MFDPRSSVSLSGEHQAEYMKVVCSINNFVACVFWGLIQHVQFAVSAKAASGYTRAIPCLTDGYP